MFLALEWKLSSSIPGWDQSNTELIHYITTLNTRIHINTSTY